MSVPLNLAAIAPTVGLGKRIGRAMILLVLGVSHFFALAYCEIGAAFSDVFFPFRMSPQPEHALWHGMTEILRFPLVTIGNGAGLSDSPLMLGFAVCNSALWAVALYLLGRTLFRAIAKKRTHSAS